MFSMIFHWTTNLNYSSHANMIETFILTRNLLWQVHRPHLKRAYLKMEFWNMKRLFKMSKLVVIISQKYWSSLNIIWLTFMQCEFSIKAICRLNSGVWNRYNFFLRPIYIFQKVVSDSVIHADSGDIEVFSHSLGIWFWQFCLEFEIAWAAAVCVGVLF